MLYLTLCMIMFIPLMVCLVGRFVYAATITNKEMLAQVLCIGVIIPAIYFYVVHWEVSDFEILNGKVIEKHIEKGTYSRPYSCHCNSKGSCSVCSERRYTIRWVADTTIGTIVFSSLDSTSSLIYLAPNPKAYSQCSKGSAASIEGEFTNYIRADQHSLFNGGDVKADVAYPRVYDFYKINRVIGDKSQTLNNLLNDKLRDVGAEKKVNVVVVKTDNVNSSYGLEVEKQWLGGKKNDVIVVLGNGWTYVFTYAHSLGNEELSVKLRDDIQALSARNDESLSNIIIEDIVKYYNKTDMKKFDYLKSEITPSNTVSVLIFIVALLLSIGLTYYMHKEDVFK